METSKLPVGPRPPESFDPKTCVGGTGSTGGPGAQETAAPNVIVQKGSTFEALNEIVRNERIVMFTGMTGAPGQAGDISINEQGELAAPVSTEVEEQLNLSLLDKIESMGLEDLKSVIVTQNTELCLALAGVYASNGNRAYTMGKALLRVKYLKEGSNLKNSFEAWQDANLDHRTLSKRTCQKYMDIARMPSVLKYVAFGSEKLAALSPVLNLFDDLDAVDPIKDFMNRFDVNPEEHNDIEEMRFAIGVGMGIARLEDEDLYVPRALVRRFMEKGFDVTRKDIEAMKAILDADGTPSTYLEKVIENGQRPTSKKASKKDTPNIHEQAQLLRDAVAKILKAPKIKGDIQVTRIDDLIKDLEALKARLTIPGALAASTEGSSAAASN